MKVNIGDYDSGIVDVEIHDHDIWNLDYTLALVILPALKRLADNPQGAPFVDNEDVPTDLHCEDDSDPKFFEKWDYVLREMVWAFEQIADEDSEGQFHTGEVDVVFQPLDKDRNKLGDPVTIGDEHPDAEFYEMVKTDKDTHHFDSEGYKLHHERIQRGTVLFGKYYVNLWT